MKSTIVLILAFTALLLTIFPSNAFSQEASKMGVNLEMGVFGEYTSGNGMGGRQFFLTPSYKIGDKANIGIGTGLKLFKYYKEESFVSAFPLYVNALYKFKSGKLRPLLKVNWATLF